MSAAHAHDPEMASPTALIRARWMRVRQPRRPDRCYPSVAPTSCGTKLVAGVAVAPLQPYPPMPAFRRKTRVSQPRWTGQCRGVRGSGRLERIGLRVVIITMRHNRPVHRCFVADEDDHKLREVDRQCQQRRLSHRNATVSTRFSTRQAGSWWGLPRWWRRSESIVQQRALSHNKALSVVEAETA